MLKRHHLLAATIALLCLRGTAMAQDKDLVLYGAGPLREAMTEMARHFTATRGVAVRTEFGASGRMRERIEAGTGSTPSPRPTSGTPASWCRTGGPA